MSSPPPPKQRDKFAALGGGGGGGGAERKKISDDRQQQTERLRQRCLQRDAVWQDIDNAEAHVTKLLHLASQTALALAQQAAGTDTSIMVDLRETQRQYRETVQEIHRLLSPHADLVQAYKAPSRVNQMYLERVEQRIAESKLELMRELLHQAGVAVASSSSTTTTTTTTTSATVDNGGGGKSETFVESTAPTNMNKKRKVDEE
jgi:hypothetical protein